MMGTEKNTADLWRDYLFLTRELVKFLGKEQDADLVQELLNQRERLQEAIEGRTGDPFRLSEEGKSLIREIAAVNEQAQQQLQLALNRSRQQQQLAKAYDQGETFNEGQRFDRSR